ncbi:MAG: sulfatase [Verrucomicrobiales bacterium]|nr:sulfatase [Verrucomicrobiales bacterium]
MKSILTFPLSRVGAPLCAILGFLALPLSAELCAASSRPNIVYILADDLGWTDLGCMGSRFYETPNIDRLAADGMRFTAYYNCQNCAPTRAALMSGQYAPRTGIYTVGSGARGRETDRRMIPAPNVTDLPLDKVTVAEALRRSGYRTGMFGKWHLGTQGDYHPSRRGFEEAIVANGRHFNFQPIPPQPVPEGVYLADWLTDLAVDFIERHRAGPFFLYLPHFAVHSPLQAKRAGIEHFERRAAVDGHEHPTYAAMIASVDESVGRVVACLERLGLSQNTVVIFSSDNGGVGGYAGAAYAGRRGTTDNWPLSEGKGSLREGGIRVPFIVRWPGVVPPGSRCDEPAIHVDLYPTFLELAGAACPTDYVLDGTSLAPLLRPGREAGRASRAIYWHFPGYLEAYIRQNTWRTTPVSVIRAGDFKLLHYYEDDRRELYDLRTDIAERVNLVGTMPEKARELGGQLAAWLKATDAPLPDPR